MPCIRSETVNYCTADPAFWQSEGAAGTVLIGVPGTRAGSPLTVTLTGATRCRNVPRHVEPDRLYELECDVRGTGRIGLVWVREGRPLKSAVVSGRERQVWTSPDDTPQFAQLAVIGEIWSDRFDPDDWQRVTLNGFSPRAANRIQMVMESLNPGGAEFDAPYLDGLGAVSGEVIIPAAYHAGGRKDAVIGVRERVSGGRFVLLTGDSVVFSGTLARWGEYVWGREYWTANFDDVAEPGTYRLRVALDGGAELLSPEFEISPALYLSLPNLTLTWYYTQRCGVEVPGWHAACHLDDALIGRSHNRKLGPGGESWTITGEADLTGGWHDAGDNHKYICWSYLALWALARLNGIQPTELRNLGEALPDPLAEAAWEARFLLKTVSPDGLFPLGVISRFGWVNVPIHLETDNIRNSGDERGLPDPRERICEIPTYGPEFTSALVASSLADLAGALRGRDDDLAARCLSTARVTWDSHHRAEPPDAEYLRWHAGFALLDVSLYGHEPAEELRADLEARVAKITAQQKPEGVFPFPKSCDGYREQVLAPPPEERAKLPDLSPLKSRYCISHEASGIDYIPNPFMYLHALLGYLELFPDGPQAGAARRALGLAMDLAVSLCERTPFGQMMEWTFAPDPLNFVHLFHGYNCSLLSLAAIAARAAKELGRPELLALAERQMQWVLGRNPRGTSLVSGVGHKQLGMYHTGLSFQEDHRTGEQPGGVVNGFVSMGAPRITYAGPTYPWDFPYLDVRSPADEAEWRGVDADWWTNETWVPNCSWFILAAVALHKALGS